MHGTVAMEKFWRESRRNVSQSSRLNGPWTCFSLNTLKILFPHPLKDVSWKSKCSCTKTPWKLHFTYLNSQPGVCWYENLAISIKHQGVFGKVIQIHLPRGCTINAIINNTSKLALYHHCKHSDSND